MGNKDYVWNLYVLVLNSVCNLEPRTFNLDPLISIL